MHHQTTRRFTPLICLLLATGLLSAQDCSPTNLSTGSFLHGNTIRALYAASGSQLWDGQEAQFQVEDDTSPYATIFAQGLWIGGLDPAGNLKISAATYGSAYGAGDYFPGPLNDQGTTNAGTCNDYERSWSVYRHEIEAHVADFSDNGVIDNPYPAVIGWPGRGNPEFEGIYGFQLPNTPQGLAPFWDSDQDGIYEPMDGEFPIEPNHELVPEHMVWTIFNTAGNISSDSESPISIDCEIHCLAWALNCTDNAALNNTVFTNYRFISRDIEAHDSVSIALWNDFDLGCFTDDAVGSAPDLNTYFAYNRDPVDDIPCSGNVPGAGENPPTQAITFLNRSLDRFIYANNGFDIPPVIGPPETNIEFYNALNGRFRDNTPITFGGNGYNPASNDVVNHVFSGDPTDPDSWSILSADISPADWRSTASTFMGSWLPGQVLELNVAHSYYREPDGSWLENISAMYDGVAELQNMYDANFENVCSSPAICDDDCVWSGDLNADGIADHVDAIALGFGQNNNGDERGGPYNWTPQAGNTWGGTQIFGTDNKHLDGNGDGISNEEDLEYTLRHYNFTRPGYEAVIEYPEGDDFTFFRAGSDPSLTGLMPGESFFARVRFNSDIPDLRAIAYTLEYDPAFFQRFDPFTGAAGADDFGIMDESVPGLVDVSWYNNDPEETISSGNLQVLHVTIRSDFPDNFPTDETEIRFRNIRGWLSDGTEIDLGAASVPIQVDGAVATDEPAWAEQFDIFPNPVRDQLNIKSAEVDIDQLQVFDSKGTLIRQIDLPNTSIDTRALPAGIYYLRIIAGSEFLVRRFVKQ